MRSDDNRLSEDLQDLIRNLRNKETEHLQNLAKKITKVPDKINVPIEYMVDFK